MFWRAVLDGLAVLTHWQVWVALALYTGLSLAWLAMIGIIMGDRDEGGTRKMVGCLLHSIGGTVFQALLIAVMIVWLLPLMLGEDHTLGASDLAAYAIPAFMFGILAAIVGVLLGVVPFLGGLLQAVPGLDAFIEGVIIFRLLSDTFIQHTLGLNPSGAVYPGLWHSLGFMLISLVLSFLAFGITFFIADKLRPGAGDSETTPLLFGPAFFRLLGLLPLFMYAAYVSSQLRV